MQAFVSDIHGNIEALTAVMQHIRGLGADEIFCLGDVVGYGPNPRECLKVVAVFAGCIRGNHEEAILNSAEDFNQQARRALEWTKEQINSEAIPREERMALWDLIGSLPDAIHRDDFMIVHGSPRDTVHEYVVPEDARDAAKMNALFERVDRPFCFIGHSHVPGVYLENLRFLSIHDVAGGFSLPQGKRAIVNVGSVGQPRDGDPRACYATLDKGIVRFHRVAYDWKRTYEKIVATGKLPLFLARRLEEGK